MVRFDGLRRASFDDLCKMGEFSRRFGNSSGEKDRASDLRH